MRAWKYKNTFLLIGSLVALYYIADTEVVHTLVGHLGTYGYAGAFVVGIFFVSTFTVVPAYVVLFHLAQVFDPFLVAIFAGAGGVLGDMLIFSFLRNGVFDELAPMLKKLKESYLVSLFKTPYFAWLTPVIGAIVIASPLPDELGVGLMGLSRVGLWQFALITFALNVAGLLALITLAKTF